MVGNTLKAALAYYTITLRLRIFPLHDVASGACSCGDPACSKNAGKHPRISDWQRESTKDFDKVFHRWWAKWPNANIGVPTGELNGIYVLDIDKYEIWNELIAEHGEIPETFSYLTGGDGRHLWFKYPENVNITNRRSGFPYGVDIRGNGGYVLVPPSKTLKGEYRFEEQ